MIRLEVFFALVLILTVVSSQQPTLYIHPQQGIKEIGSNVAFFCKFLASEDSIISRLEWRDPDGRKIEKNSTISVFSEYSANEDLIILVFKSLQRNQGGKYTCTANYANSEKLNASIELQPYVRMRLSVAQENEYPLEGKDFLIRCIVEGYPTPLVSWIRNNERLISNGKYILLNEGLIIRNVQESDTGVYTCSAIQLNTGEIREKYVNIEPQTAPRIQPMTNIVANEGETVSTKCTATGKPPPSYVWIKERTRKDLSKTDRFVVKNNTGDLIITNLESADDGVYKCVAENRGGAAESSVKITVARKPEIYELLNITYSVGSEARIRCKAQGQPTPKLFFRKLSQKKPFVSGAQTDDNRIILEHQIFEKTGKVFIDLIITSLSRSDDGLYECLATNTAGDNTKIGHIAVDFPPTFDLTRQLPQVWGWDEKPGNLTCIAEAIPNATITWKFDGIEIKDSPNFKIIGIAPISHLIVNLQHNIPLYGNYQCVAMNQLGVNSIDLKLNRAYVPEPIQEVRLIYITPTTIKFNIVPPKYFDTLPIISIMVQYKHDREFFWANSKNHTWNFNASYILEDLIPETIYQFRCAAINDVGIGAWTNIQTVIMPPRNVPQEPNILLSNQNINSKDGNNQEIMIDISPYADRFELKWTVPNDNGAPIDGYLIRYYIIQTIESRSPEYDCNDEIRVPKQFISHELTDLKPDTIYQIELRAHNKIGSSTPANIRIRTTKE